MDNHNQEDNTVGFLLSFNLMLIGGLLLLGCIVSLNKLLNHHFHEYWEQSRGILSSVGQIEADTFVIRSETELYLTWILLLFCLFGLVMIIRKLVKTWTL